jgi:hypothetical protein
MRNKLGKVERIGKLECGYENLTEKENSTEVGGYIGEKMTKQSEL